ncbi:Transcription factor E2FA [Capsicum annuum]|uniref:Transcription factor E2FA n=1 Tax=Capsicum annuum TaxID=4072 RepID=A0A2G3AG78_CAPAN|nr:Transcription factor E2FA [Capsicum annuum]
MQRSDDIMVDSSVAGKWCIKFPVSMDNDQKTDGSSTSSNPVTEKTARVLFSGKEIPYRASSNSINHRDKQLIYRKDSSPADWMPRTDWIRREMQENLRDMSEDKKNQRWLFVTEDDIKSLPCFQNKTLIAVKSPHGTTLEVSNPGEAVDYPQRRYRIILRSTMGPIDVYLISQFKEKFEEMNGVEPSTTIPDASSSGSKDYPATEILIVSNNVTENGGQTQNVDQLSSDVGTSEDYGGGMMKIVPSDVDDALKHVFASRIADINNSPHWNLLSFISCACNGLVLMDDSLQLLPAIETLDLRRNKFTRIICGSVPN